MSTRQMNQYLKQYCGVHKPTTVRVYVALHAFTGLPDGARPKVQTIADMAGVSPRTVNSAFNVLVADGLLTIEARHDRHGRPLPNRYVLRAVSSQKASSFDLQALADSAETCAGVVEELLDTNQRDLEDLRDQEESLDWTGPHYVRHTASGGVCSTARADSQEKQAQVGPGMNPEASSRTTGTPGGAAGVPEDPSNVESTQGAARNRGLAAMTQLQARIDFSQPLADADLELGANEVVDLLDKLAVRHGGRPLTDGARPGQLKSARYLLAHDKVREEQAVRVIRWIFSGTEGTAKWAKKITKPYVLRDNFPQLLQAFRKAELSAGSELPVEPVTERTPEEKENLRRRLLGLSVPAAHSEELPSGFQTLTGPFFAQCGAQAPETADKSTATQLPDEPSPLMARKRQRPPMRPEEPEYVFGGTSLQERLGRTTG